MWLCLCDCGNETIAKATQLVKGSKKSCGCRKSISTIKRNFVHGHTHTRLYRIWSLMKDRCNNINTHAYVNYGGRGITVCDEWLSFEPFYEWAMNNGYTQDLSIDRINNNGNYEPSNCRWATVLEQATNKRTNRIISFNGVSRTMSEWARSLGLDYKKLHYRLKNGWTIAQAFANKTEKVKAVK